MSTTQYAGAVVRLPTGHRHDLPDARRADPERLAQEIELVGRSPVVAALLDAVDATLIVLNAERQIVAMNGPASKARELAGLRPGEALACVNAVDGAGCGAAPACQVCGALGAILGCAGTGRPVEAECLLRGAEPGAAREFNVRASPVTVEGRAFTVVSLRDVSGEKRRESLEQLFFHDVLNTVAGLRGWAWRLKRPGADVARAGERVDRLSRQLEREIRDHRALVLAEQGELVPSLERVRVADLLAELELLVSGHDAARDRRLEIAPVDEALELDTDPALLGRVLVNMTRNALEASPPGGVARVSCEPVGAGEGLRFAVRNDGVIPPEVRPRIFQRSFSTKAPRGRGLGTYGMKLFGERHLGGRVSFTSSEAEGTTFSIELPRSAPLA
ncbi:MAG TPA: ATP-binding protein [Anaeromyxobacteraceae bacterium]|nr:ATP-binding protein [Anaeromyxobacteraceae bacterium]